MIKRPSFFFAQSGDTGGGSPGQSGANALDTTISAGDAIDPLTYLPPGEADIDTFLTGGDDATLKGTTKKPEPPASTADDEAKAAAEAVAKEADDKAKADAAKKTEKPEGSEPASKLRVRLKELEEQKATLESELSAARSDKRVDELTAKIAEKEKAILAKETDLETANRKLLVHNPLVSKRLVELREAFNAEYAQTLETLPELKGTYKGLVDEFAALPRGADDYAAKLKEFRGKMKDQFGDDAATAFEAVRKGFDFTQKHAKMADEVQRDAQKIEFEERAAEWATRHGEIEKQWGKWFEPPADAAATDPFNHNLFLQTFESGMDKAEVEKVNRNLRNFVDRAFNGAQPRTKADFPGMSDADIQEQLSTTEEVIAQTKNDAKRILAVGAKLLAYFRPIMADYAKMRARLGEKAGALPPDPTKTDGVKSKAGIGSAELEDMVFKSPEEIELEVNAG